MEGCGNGDQKLYTNHYFKKGKLKMKVNGMDEVTDIIEATFIDEVFEIYGIIEIYDVDEIHISRRE